MIFKHLQRKRDHAKNGMSIAKDAAEIVISELFKEEKIK